MAEWKQDVVRITYERPDRTGVSTGYAISPSLVLTARHVVFGEDGNVRPKLMARLCWQAVTGNVEATPVWPDGPAGEGADLALLALKEELPTTKRPLHLSARVVDRRQDWMSRGFPSLDEPAKAEADRDHQEPQGQTCPCTDKDQRISLDVTTQANYWHGLSGAPVVVQGAVVAVVKSVDPDYKGALYATPLHVVRENDVFWERAGLGSAAFASKVDEEVTKVEERAASILRPHATTLTQRIAKRLLVDPPAVDAVAQRLVRHTPASELGRHLDFIDDELWQEPGSAPQRAAVRELLVLVLPYAVDLRAEATKIRTALARGVGTVTPQGIRKEP